MFRTTRDTQINFEDRLLTMNEQTQKAVDASRAKLVGDVIYPNVDEEKFAVLFSEVFSRPNISISQYFCALTLKRMYHLSDEVFLEFLRCGAINFQYALHTTQDEKQPLSESSLRRFRRRIEAYREETGRDLIEEEFERISKMMAVDMGLLGKDPSDGEDETTPILVRMDSMEIEAHAKTMTRIEILYMTNVIMIRYLLKKGYKELIPQALSHYMETDDRNKIMYYRVAEDKKAGVQDTRVAVAIDEMVLLQKSLTENFTQKFLLEIPEYAVFQRVLEEQTILNDEGQRVPKDKKDISPTSVQNPFDATVTYRYKRGQHHGHVLNVVEAVDDNGNGIVVHAQIAPNTTSDNRLAENYLEQLPDNGPKTVLSADGAYSSEEMKSLAEQKNVEIRNTALTGKIPDDIFADFVLNEEGTKILECPAGKVPDVSHFNPATGRITATMPDNCCANCPNRDKCKAQVGKRKPVSRVQVTSKTVERAKQARECTSEEGKKNAQRRNGVEGVMSVMRRKYDLDHIPVFGSGRLSLWIWTSLLSYNLVKYQKYKSTLEKQPLTA